jgi:hypothetical protein
MLSKCSDWEVRTHPLPQTKALDTLRAGAERGTLIFHRVEADFSVIQDVLERRKQSQQVFDGVSVRMECCLPRRSPKYYFAMVQILKFEDETLRSGGSG